MTEYILCRGSHGMRCRDSCISCFCWSGCSLCGTRFCMCCRGLRQSAGNSRCCFGYGMAFLLSRYIAACCRDSHSSRMNRSALRRFLFHLNIGLRRSCRNHIISCLYLSLCGTHFVFIGRTSIRLHSWYGRLLLASGVKGCAGSDLCHSCRYRSCGSLPVGGTGLRLLGGSLSLLRGRQVGLAAILTVGILNILIDITPANGMFLNTCGIGCHAGGSGCRYFLYRRTSCGASGNTGSMGNGAFWCWRVSGRDRFRCTISGGRCGG